MPSLISGELVGEAARVVIQDKIEKCCGDRAKNICFWAAISADRAPIESAICGPREGRVLGNRRRTPRAGYVTNFPERRFWITS
jgi:hypothetical protein